MTSAGRSRLHKHHPPDQHIDTGIQPLTAWHLITLSASVASRQKKIEITITAVILSILDTVQMCVRFLTQSTRSSLLSGQMEWKNVCVDAFGLNNSFTSLNGCQKDPSTRNKWIVYFKWHPGSCLGLVIVQKFWYDTDTLSSIPVPERYFFWYQFYEINFNKIISKNFGFIFSACWHLYRLEASSPEPLHKGAKYIQHNKSVQIVNKVQIVFSLHICEATFTLVRVRFKMHSSDRIIISIHLF